MKNKTEKIKKIINILHKMEKDTVDNQTVTLQIETCIDELEWLILALKEE